MGQEATIDIDRMLGELHMFCRKRILCGKNQKDGKTCIFYGYCATHSDFHSKDIEMLYERMKKMEDKE